MRSVLIFLAFIHTALALEIREIRWGFDGKAMPNRFNLLSVLVAQEGGARPFDGELALIETRGGELGVGAPIAQPLYLTPGTQRWVQFVPFVSQENEWRLRWGQGEKARFVVPAAKFGPPATVLLRDATAVFADTARLAAFPDELFPTSVAATDALDQIVLDHTPRWDAPRREAFLDWLRRGGIVHLLRGPEGHPRFEGDLAVLNETGRIGAGRVIRHDVGREDCDEAFLAKAGYARREFKKQEGNTGPMLYRFDQTLLQNLASLTKPQVQWWLLYLLTLAYLAFIGPVHYAWSRKVDWRLAIAGFLGTVAVFALAFIIAGHRGSGEKQTSHSLAIARSLGGDRWDVQEWVSAFATKGDFYKLTHTAPANYYSALSDAEGVNGKITGGKDGHFDVDIPLYSARPFLHRAVMSGPKAEVKVIEWKADKLVLELPETFPRVTGSAHLRLRGQIRSVAVDGRKIAYADSKGGLVAPEDHWFSDNELRALQQFEWTNRMFDPKSASTPLFARSLGGVKAMPHALTPRPLSPDHLQIFLFAEAPASFAMKGKGFDRGRGHVLYVIDVFRPDSSASASSSSSASPARKQETERK
ncbi:MAG: hypothetical protein ABMA13_22405 [Chthoniobacteraceae bacterium]